jgi:uncharacterized membrane protein YkvA (DUF1232 family)
VIGSRVQAWARRLKADAHAAWIAARDPRCPWGARVVGLGVTAYALSPIDLIPDFIPVLGLLDDAILVPAGIWLFVRLLPAPLWEECRARARAEATRPKSLTGMMLVIALWIGSALLGARAIGLI